MNKTVKINEFLFIFSENMVKRGKQKILSVIIYDSITHATYGKSIKILKIIDLIMKTVDHVLSHTEKIKIFKYNDSAPFIDFVIFTELKITLKCDKIVCEKNDLLTLSYINSINDKLLNSFSPYLHDVCCEYYRESYFF